MSNCEDLIPRIFYKNEKIEKQETKIVEQQLKNDEIDFGYITPYTRGINMPDWLGVFDKNDLVILA
jgi:Golgi nucleoside diphosphatase